MADISKGIVLGVTEYDERDGIATILFEDGRVMDVFAAGIQVENSKNMMNLQPFSIVEVEYFQRKERTKAKLMRSTTLKASTAKDIRDLNTNFLISSLFMGLEHVDKKVYSTLKEIIESQEFETVNIFWIFYMMKLILIEQGININYWSCSVCGTQERISSFDLKKNGLLCKNHREESQEILPNTLRKIIKLFEAKDFAEIKEVTLAPVEIEILKQQFNNYFEDILGINVVNLKYI